MACALGISLTLEGCGLTANDPKQAQNENTSPYIPVQDYAGQGYSLPNGEKTGAFAKTHKKEIVAILCRTARRQERLRRPIRKRSSIKLINFSKRNIIWKSRRTI
ncbi:DUF1672 family protein [Sporolactobacillus sp. CQH2019]|uniref:DUF1672 family protein n=1 Tax=Sporolactobacillus sp. CQH2019 TaxID=3023512 RepID=UPI003FD526D0